MQLSDIEKIQIPGCIKPEHFVSIRYELHHFSDASTNGYGQCSYLRALNNEGEITCHLIMSKARVAPTKHVSIPRLELSAAVTSVKISILIAEELKLPNVKHYYWTDSTVVLSYISNESHRFHTFVANRVQLIRDHTEPTQWNHVSSEKNPADLASRGCTAADLDPKWFNGPSFLYDEVLPFTSCKFSLQVRDPEVKNVTLATKASEGQPTLLE